MNNQFNYNDERGQAAPKVTSARKLSTGQWYVNGKILDPEKLSLDQKEGAKALQALHNARLNNSPAEIKRQALKKLESYKKKSPENKG